MEKLQTQIENVIILKNFNSEDIRGKFIKVYNKDELTTNIKEIYYTVSKKDVIRGMHFQKPPFSCEKIVTVISGSIEDVIMDLRKESTTYGKTISFKLEAGKGEAIFIPKGCAHGFKSLENNTVMLYAVSEVYNKESDSGIRWDSIDFNWNVENPIISERDKNFDEFKNFISPF